VILPVNGKDQEFFEKIQKKSGFFQKNFAKSIDNS